MSRIDDFLEMLDSYEGREYDSSAELLKEFISSNARDVYDSLSPEVQKRILNYFDCVRRTGLIMLLNPKGNCITESVESNPDFFDQYLLNNIRFRVSTEDGLGWLKNELDERIQLYETEEK